MRMNFWYERPYESRSVHPRSPHLSQRAYRLGLAVTLMIWALLLMCLVWVVKLPTFLQRDDFSVLAQISASLSTICLALLGFVQADNPANKYLKLALSALSLEFVLGTFLSVVSLVMINAAPKQPFQQTVTLVFLAGIMVSGSVANLVGLNSAPEKLKHFEYLRISPVVRRRLTLLNDAVPLWLPPASIALWVYPLNLASAALVLMLGGLTYLLVMSILFTFTTLAQPPDEDSRLKAAILEIHRAEHEARCSGKPSLLVYEGISIEDIFDHLLKKQIIKNPHSISRILYEMVDENLIFACRNKSFYIFPNSDKPKPNRKNREGKSLKRCNSPEARKNGMSARLSQWRLSLLHIVAECG